MGMNISQIKVKYINKSLLFIYFNKLFITHFIQNILNLHTVIDRTLHMMECNKKEWIQAVCGDGVLKYGAI